MNSEIGKFSFGKSLFIGKLVQSEHDCCQKGMEQLKFVLVIKLEENIGNQDRHIR